MYGESNVTLFAQVLGVLIGFVLVIKAGGHLDRMTHRTDHMIRVGYIILAIGGGALVLGPFAHDAPWMLELGWLLCGCGACLFLLYGRREQEADKKLKG